MIFTHIINYSTVLISITFTWERDQNGTVLYPYPYTVLLWKAIDAQKKNLKEKKAAQIHHIYCDIWLLSTTCYEKGDKLRFETTEDEGENPKKRGSLSYLRFFLETKKIKKDASCEQWASFLFMRFLYFSLWWCFDFANSRVVPYCTFVLDFSNEAGSNHPFFLSWLLSWFLFTIIEQFQPMKDSHDDCMLLIDWLARSVWVCSREIDIADVLYCPPNQREGAVLLVFSLTTVVVNNIHPPYHFLSRWRRRMQYEQPFSLENTRKVPANQWQHQERGSSRRDVIDAGWLAGYFLVFSKEIKTADVFVFYHTVPTGGKDEVQHMVVISSYPLLFCIQAVPAN